MSLVLEETENGYYGSGLNRKLLFCEGFSPRCGVVMALPALWVSWVFVD